MWARSARRGGRSPRPSGQWRAEHGRRTRPWIPEPGLWLQFDYGDGPVIGGRRTSLLCAWLAWSRYRVVVRAGRSDVAERGAWVWIGCCAQIGGVPTYVLTDNERTVTVDHVCGIAVRNPKIVAAARHYGFAIQTCVPADPQSKGGIGGDGPDREGRSGPDRSQPARRVRELRGARGRVPRVLRARQRARAPRHAPAAGGDAGRGARAAAPVARARAHAVFRRDAQGVLAVDGLGRRRDLLRPVRAGRCSVSGSAPTATSW